MRVRHPLLAAISAASLCGISSSSAVNVSWNGATTGLWTDTANWSTGTVPVAADVVTFNTPGTNANETIYLNGNEAAASLNFNNTGTTGFLGGVSGTPAVNTLTLTTGITVNAGAGAVTIGDTSAGAAGAVNLLLGGAMAFTNNSANLLTVANGVSITGTTARTLTIGGTGSTLFSGVLANGGATLSLAVTGTGTTTLAGANTYTGTTSVTSGTLNLDYTTANSSHLADAAALTLVGGTVNLTGGTHTEVVSATTISAGASSVVQTMGGSVLRLNTVTRSAGGSLNFSAAGVADLDNALVNGIVGGYATVGTTGAADWASTAAATGADRAITAYTAYTTYDGTASGATANYLLTGTAMNTASLSANTLKINTSGTGQSLDLGAGQTLTLTSGGLLFVGVNDFQITGGTLASATGTSPELIFQQRGAGILTVNSSIANGTGGNTSVTKAGGGVLVLGGINTYSGTTYVDQGILRAGVMSLAFGVGSPVVVSTGATLDLGGFDESVASLASNGAGTGAVTLGANTLTLASNTGTTAFAGVISGTGGISKTGASTQTLSGVNTYTGVTTLANGVLNAGSLAAVNTPSAIGQGSAAGSAADLVFSGGTLQYTGATATSTNRLFTINGAATLDSSSATSTASINFSGTGSVVLAGGSAATLTLAGTNTGFTDGNNAGTVAQSNTFSPVIGDQNASSPTSVVKNGVGAWNIANGSNGYTGGTMVNAGRLLSSATGSFGSGTVAIASGAQVVLAGGGNYTNNITMAGTGRDYAVGGGVHAVAGALVITNNSVASGVLTMTGDTRVSATAVNSGLTAAGTISGQITGAYNLEFNSGGVTSGGVPGGTVTLSNPANNWTGNTTITAVTTSGSGTMNVALGASDVIPNGVSAGNLILTTGAAAPATFTMNGFNETINGLVSAGAGTGARTVRNNSTTVNSTLTLGDNNTTAAYSGVIINGATGGTLAITKIGTGTQTFSGVNSYTGATTVNGGILAIDSVGATTQRLSGTTSLNLNSGGMLMLLNSGATASTDRLANAAALSLGGGTLNLGGLTEGAASATNSGIGALILSATSTIDFGTTGASNLLQLASVGAHTAGALLQITNYELGSDHLYFVGTSTAFTNAYVPTDVLFNGTAGYTTQSFTGYYEVIPNAVPEPGTWACLLLMAGGGFIWRRKRVA